MSAQFFQTSPSLPRHPVPPVPKPRTAPPSTISSSPTTAAVTHQQRSVYTLFSLGNVSTSKYYYNNTNAHYTHSNAGIQYFLACSRAGLGWVCQSCHPSQATPTLLDLQLHLHTKSNLHRPVSTEKGPLPLLPTQQVVQLVRLFLKSVVDHPVQSYLHLSPPEPTSCQTQPYNTAE